MWCGGKVGEDWGVYNTGSSPGDGVVEVLVQRVVVLLVMVIVCWWQWWWLCHGGFHGCCFD